MGFRGKFWGVLTAILGLAFLYVTAYQVPEWVSFMPDNYLKTLFWIGYVGQVVTAIFIKPFMIIARDEEGSPFAPVQGVISFVFGLILSLVLYYLFDGFFGIGGVFTGTNALQGDLTGIMWFMYILITVISIVVAPLYLAYEEPFTDEMYAQLGGTA